MKLLGFLFIFLSFNLQCEMVDFHIDLKIIDKKDVIRFNTNLIVDQNETLKVAKDLYQLELQTTIIKLPNMNCVKALKVTGTLTQFENHEDKEGTIVGNPELFACLNKKSYFESSIEKNDKYFTLELTPRHIQ